MTHEQIQALKAAAEKASVGEWIKESSDGWDAVCSDDDQANSGFIIAHFVGPDSQVNREFIQAVNPSAILSLLAERDADKALIAEQRQAITKLEISCDRNYVEGMKTGWNYCDAGNSDGFNTCVEQREKDIRDASGASITLDVGE